MDEKTPLCYAVGNSDAHPLFFASLSDHCNKESMHA